MKGFRFWAVVAVMLVPVSAPAGDEPEEHALGTVVVTATRGEQPIEQATTSISAITAEEIESRHADTVVELLRGVPGVDVTQQGSSGTSASVHIRGADADQTLMLVDGVEVNSPTLGEFNFGTLTADNLDRIEVLRGAGGTLYGSEAVGGVVNLVTKRGTGRPQFSLLNEGGNGDTQRHRLSFSGAQQRLGFSGSLSYQSSGGFRPVNDDYSNLAAALRLDADVIERGTLRGFFRYHDAVVGLFNNLYYQGLSDPNARFSEERYLFKGEWEHRPADSLRYRLAGAVVHDSETFTDPDAAATFASAVRSRIPTQITTGEAQATYYAGSAGITTAGVEFKEKEARPKSLNVNFAPPPPLLEQDFAASRSVYAGYVQQQLLLLDEHLIATGGLRVDDDEGFGREVSAAWSVGYLHDWDGSGRWATRLKGGYAEGFKAPTFNELFYPGFGNPDLDAETSSEYDGGAVQQLWGERLSVEATYFTRRTANLIQAVCDPTTYVCTAQNAGRVDVQGVETGVSLRPLAGLTLRGTYTYLDFEVLGGSRTLLRRPHNRMAAGVRYRLASPLQAEDAIDLAGNVNFAGDRADVDPTTFTTVNNPNYTVADVAVTYGRRLLLAPLQRVELFGRIGNLFDRNYQEALGFKASPINFVVGTQLTF
ncbi:MAG: TonB-dependent receptor [Deltaproteobacteria bacterium]|nr:TonB-dependent receptor [Deltaproteobacteria bacterium]